MAKYHRFNPLSWLRSLRWWAWTYGAIRFSRHPLLGLFLRTPPFSVWVLAAGFGAGVWYVLNYVPCP